MPWRLIKALVDLILNFLSLGGKNETDPSNQTQSEDAKEKK
jgi:hypothetical protein